MKQKRLKKLMMSYGISRNTANNIIRASAALRRKMQSSRYKEIYRLSLMLDETGILFSCTPHMDGFHLICYDRCTEAEICSVVEHRFSYGHEGDYLEIMGLLTEGEKKLGTVRGWLTAKDVLERVQQYYKENSNE